MKKKQSSYQIQKQKAEQIKRELEEVKNAKKAPKNSALISGTIPYIQTLYRIREDISTFNAALLRAENIHSPQRSELYRLFKTIMLDGHLSATIQNRKASILSTEFIVTKKGKEQDKLSDIFKTKWFLDFCNLALDSFYFGFSLIEIYDFDDKNMEFGGVDLIAREYVKPEFGIVGNTPSDMTGPSFLEKPYSLSSIGVGDKTNLGLLTKAAPYILWKKGAMMAYAEYCEMMGIPVRVLSTSAYDEETRGAAENMMRNMAASAYAVIGLEDKLTLTEAKNAAGVDSLFNGLTDKCNQEVSKLILGGTGLMDEKAYVGSSNVHQENFLMICGQDKKFIQNVLNYQLLPFLLNYGFPLQGCRFEIKPDEELSLIEQFKIDSKLLDYYKVPASYFNEKYGTQFEDLSVDSTMAKVPVEKTVKKTSDNTVVENEQENTDKTIE